MFGIGEILASIRHRESIEQHDARMRRREAELATAVPWSDDMPWQKRLVIQSKTYRPLELFDVDSCPGASVQDDDPKVVSPSSRWAYVHKCLPRGESLRTFHGSSIGSVVFDGDVIVPALHERHNYCERWRQEPWMSLTPMELLTLRPGTRRAKGRVVVAGLGLGHQLIEVSKRKQVKSIVLLERDRHLVEWLMPRIAGHMHRQLDAIIIGDVYRELPKLHADVALVDVFPCYGNNDYEQGRLRASCPNIGHVWCWGTARIS